MANSKWSGGQRMSIGQGVSSFNLADTPAFLPMFTEVPSAPNPINLLSQFEMPSISKEFLIVAITSKVEKDTR